MTNLNIINIILNILNIKIKVHGVNNLKYYNSKKMVIMANHYAGVDHPIIAHAISYHTNNSKKIYTIVKHNVFGDENDKSTISNFLGLFRKDLYKFFCFLPYVRDCKNSGNEIKNKMIDTLNNNDTILLFPEGTGNYNGIPTNFKSGSFIMCAENNISILPITLKLNKNIGESRKDKVTIKQWFNLEADIIIHKPMFDKDWTKLKKNVFDQIKKPFD